VIAPYLDSSAIIYLIEGSPTVRAQVAAHIAAADSDPTAGSSPPISPGLNAA